MKRISVIIPVYNRANLLKRALKSIECQTLMPAEVIIVDDGSTQDLRFVLQDYKRLPLTYHRLPENLGAAAARNAGIKLAKYEIIAFLDSDDEWLPRKLENHLAFHESVGGLISTTGYSIIEREGACIRERVPNKVQKKEDIFKGCFLAIGSTMLADRKVFQEVGVFDSNLKRLEDWEWLIRITEKNQVHVLPEVLSRLFVGKRPTYAAVVCEVDKIKKIYKEREIRAYGEIEKGFLAICEQKYLYALKHFTHSILSYPFVFFDLVDRSLKRVRDEIRTSQGVDAPQRGVNKLPNAFRRDISYRGLNVTHARLVAAVLGNLRIIQKSFKRAENFPERQDFLTLLVIAASNGHLNVYSFLLRKCRFIFSKNEKKLIIDVVCQNHRIDILKYILCDQGWSGNGDLIEIATSAFNHDNFDSVVDLVCKINPRAFQKISSQLVCSILSSPLYEKILEEPIWKKLTAIYCSSFPNFTSEGVFKDLVVKRLKDFCAIGKGKDFLAVIDKLEISFANRYYLEIINVANQFQDFSLIRFLITKGISLQGATQAFSNIPASSYKSELLDLSLINEIVGDEPYIFSMVEEVKQALPIYHPSQFWSFFSDIHMTQLRELGIESFKQNVNQSYYNYVPLNIWDPFVVSINLLKLFGKIHKTNKYELKNPDMNEKEEIWKRKYRCIFQGRTEYQKKLYQNTVGLLIDYAKLNDPEQLMEKLEEPELGGPIEMRLNGKLVSQDLANSVLERYSILNSIKHDPCQKLNIVEIGAGYGRLAYVFLQTSNCKYVIFDIAPALYVAQSYLSLLFKNKKIFKFRSFKNFEEIQKEFEKSDIAFFTINQIQYFPENYFDLSINISSLHEMRRDQVSYILNQMSRVTNKYIYIKQYKKYKNPQDKIFITFKDYKFNQEWKNIMYRTLSTNRRFFEAMYKKIEGAL